MSMREKNEDGRSGWFDGMTDAPIYESGKYFAPGSYDVTIREVKRFKSTQSDKKFFCVEFEIDNLDLDLDQIEAWQDGGKDSDAYAEAIQLKSGGSVSWLVDLGQKSALSNIKAFCLAIMPGAEEDQITGGVVEDLCEDEQPAAGAQLCVEAYYVRTRAGHPFTKMRWKLLTEED